MHMEGEKIGSEICSCFTSNIFNYVFTIHSLTEGNYIYEVLKLDD
jgi:hypothetical protein